MSKRSADEYITKEHGSTPNVDRGASYRDKNTLTMSTPAQLAARKIRNPRGRLNHRASTVNVSVSANPSNQNPFNANTPQPQQTFGSVGGMTFGASQSFPTGIQPPSGGFTFQTPQSASFTFGAAPTPSNPFANSNGIANNNSFANTNGNTNPAPSHDEDSMMESPQKKPNVFGTGFGNNTNGGPGFSFGQAAQPQVGGMFGGFGGSQKNSNATGNLFGQNTQPATSQPSNSMFGQPPAAQPALGFGNNNSASQSQSLNFGGFGQSTGFNFGQSQSAAQPSSVTASFGDFHSQPASDVAFGGASPMKTDGPASHGGFSTAEALARPVEGSVDVPGSQPASNPFGGTFGITSSQPTNATFTFGQTAGSAPPSNPFAGFATTPLQVSQPASSVFGRSQSAPQLFGQAPVSAAPQPAAVEQTQPSSQPFSSLFAPKQAPVVDIQEPATKPTAFNFGASPTPSANVPTSKASGSIFSNVPKSAEPSSSIFSAAQPTSSETPTAASISTAKNVFNFPKTQPPSSGGLFTPAKLAEAEPSKSQGLFGNSSRTALTEQATQKAENPTAKASDSSETRSPTEAAQPEAAQAEPPKAPQWGNGNLFGRVSQPPAAENSTDFNKPSAVSAPQTPSVVSSATVFNVNPENSGAPSSNVGSNPPADSSNEPSTDRETYTKSAPRIPTYLNGDGYKEYDSNYRLRGLNRQFKERIAALDPEMNDFENLIRHYVAVRESIGASLGLYMRNPPGSKRKKDDVEENIPSQYKRSKVDAAQDTGYINATSFVPQTNSATATSVQKPTAPSKAAQVFQTLIPDSTANTAAQALQSLQRGSPADTAGPTAPEASTKSLFGETPKPKQPVQLESTALSASNPFAQGAPSTTPTKSPPKKKLFGNTIEPQKPAFGMPKPPMNAMALWNQKADAEKEARKQKRKADEYDSDDDPTEIERELEEEERKKRAKYDAIPKTGFNPMALGSNNGASSATTPSPFTFGSSSKSQSAEPSTTATGFSFGNSTPSFGGLKPTFGTSFADPAKSFDFFGVSSTPNTSDKADDDAGIEDDDEEESGESEEYGEQHDGDYQQEEESSESSGSGEERAEPEDDLAEDDLPEDDLPEDEVQQQEGKDDNDQSDSDGDYRTALNRSRSKLNPNVGKSLFERVEPPSNRQPDKTPVNGAKQDMEETSKYGAPILQSAKNDAFKSVLWGSEVGKSTPEAPAFSPITPATGSREPYKPATTFNFTPTPPTTAPTPVAGASIFDGGAVNPVAAKYDGLFGSRPSTPSNAGKSTNVFSQNDNTSHPSGDHTWKTGSAIKFGTPEKVSGAPALNLIAASPSADDDKSAPKELGVLFGNSTSASKSTDLSATLGFNFGTPSISTAPGFLGAASHLVPGSATSSAMSSRATSPGLTDNESVATNDTEETPEDKQTSLMDTHPGEENEDLLWEGRSKALKFFSKGELPKGTKLIENSFNSMGVGILRILKHKDTGKTRVIFRVEPRAAVIFNEYLIPNMQYKVQNSEKGESGAVNIPAFHSGKVDRWVFKIKTKAMSEELHKILESNKMN